MPEMFSMRKPRTPNNMSAKRVSKINNQNSGTTTHRNTAHAKMPQKHTCDQTYKNTTHTVLLPSSSSFFKSWVLLSPFLKTPSTTGNHLQSLPPGPLPRGTGTPSGAIPDNRSSRFRRSSWWFAFGVKRWSEKERHKNHGVCELA